ncbi:MAG: YggS family pyridoxal phosphate-dependent enzyme [Alphaproteobacteria bacterium]|nr:YggS family pyridoxal phosphate-dependent enzyme [Alphaproteobacteria bacterium]
MSRLPIPEGLQRVRARLDAACAASGRDPASVGLIAVSKTRPLDDVLAAARAGQRLFGENYAQELRDKAAALAEQSNPPPVAWHFIGHLQRNKVRYVVNTAALIHTVDSLRLAGEIAKRAEHPQAILAQVNVGDEASKSGVAVDEALALCEQLDGLEGVALRGLMTIPPAVADPADAAVHFRTLAELAAEGRRRGLPLTELSMGMSSDFEVAIAHGATLVRVGTAIFGPRG